jgi:hypothetical protein
MTTDHQRALLEAEDWRYHAIGPVGSTGIGSISTTEKFREKIVSFGLPSASALYPSAARNAHMRRAAIDLSSVLVPHLQGTWSEDHSPLFDYFESFASEVIFSFTALEAFANEVIPADFTYQFKSNKKSGTVPLSKAEIERQVSLDEKLKSVLPQAHNIKSPNGTKPWQDYKELKDVRNRLIHLKSIDRKTSGPEHQTLWGLMLKEQNSVFPDMTARKIRHFETLVKDRR